MERSLAMTIALALATAGCFTARPLPTPVPERAKVRVRFDPPRALNAVGAGGDVRRVEGVTELYGRVLAARGDTLHVELTEVRVGRLSAGVAGRRAPIVPEPDRPAELWRLSATRTAAAVLLPPVLVVATILFYVFCCWDYSG